MCPFGVHNRRLIRSLPPFPLIFRVKKGIMERLYKTSSWSDVSPGGRSIGPSRCYYPPVRATKTMITPRELTAVMRVGASLDLAETLKAACRAAVELFAVDRCAFLAWDTLPVGRVSAAQYPEFQNQGEEGHFSSAPIVQQVIQARRPALVERVNEGGALLGQLRDDLIKLQIGSALFVPALFGDEILGCLRLDLSGRTAQFNEDGIDLCQAFATQAAAAIQNARRFEELKKIKGYVGSHTALEWMKIVNQAWAHNMRGEVGTALGHAQLLERMIDAGNISGALAELQELKMTVKRIGDIPMVGPLSSEDKLDSVRVNDLVTTYVARLWKHSRYASVKLRYALQENLDSIAVIRASNAWLRQVLLVLIDNAVEAMSQRDTSDNELTVTTRLVRQEIEISVRDTGPGIPEDLRDMLFTRPVAKPVGSKGAGIGLMLARAIVETYGGHIGVTSSGAEGTEITIAFPSETPTKKIQP